MLSIDYINSIFIPNSASPHFSLSLPVVTSVLRGLPARTIRHCVSVTFPRAIEHTYAQTAIIIIIIVIIITLGWCVPSASG